jgi:hypothetical protein
MNVLSKINGLIVSIILISSCSESSEIKYTIADVPWQEDLGNHRTVMEIPSKAEAVHLNYLWRRHDRKIEDKEFIIINKETGARVSNIHRVEVNNEKCELIFGPVEKGTYFFYYLPYEVQVREGYYRRNYNKKEEKPDKNWTNNMQLQIESLPRAEVLEIQARVPFDSFYPMEVIATEEEKELYTKEYASGNFVLFPEDRIYPIRMLDEVPLKWIESPLNKKFEGSAMINEYYPFQLGLWAFQMDIKDVKIEFSELTNGEEVIEANKLTCFNIEGIDPMGKAFDKRVDVSRGDVQPLWIGVDINKDVKPGTYSGTISVTAENASVQQVELKLKIKNEVLEDRGDSELWRHSRLRWLNSTAGINDEPTSDYSAIEIHDKTLKILGRELTYNTKGYPASIKTGETEILSNDIDFILETKQNRATFEIAEPEELLNAPGKIAGRFRMNNNSLDIVTTASLESDGYALYNIKIKAKKDVKFNDIRLEIPFHKEVAQYVMGMGLPGSNAPNTHQAKWKGPHDAFWMGNSGAGLHCELRGASYTGPLLNAYRPEYPQSWDNKGKGGFKIHTSGYTRKAVVYSGERRLERGDELEFEFALIITPVKQIDTKRQFTDRYFHNALKPNPSEEQVGTGIKVINVHHANQYNPNINYPFIEVDKMKGFVDKWHARGMKVKIYYTIRELTNYVEEIWALRSLGDEILYDGPGGGFPWLREHFISNYDHRWYQRIDSLQVDAAIRNSPNVSRWYNYYVEGLKWLVKNVDIDGLYLDDVAYDRNMLKRMRKVMDEVKPGCFIDLHSNTGFSIGPATQYTEFFPYVDKTWFGESFRYDDMSPANWLVECSGIPFGLMGDMLQGGGNPWRGMIYGMTARLPWTTDGVISAPSEVWKVWDSFGIMDARMIPYWDDQPVVTTSHKDVLATAYLKEGKMLISIASWAEKNVNVTLNINWKKAGLNPDQVNIYAPPIDKFQSEREFEIGDSIPVEPVKGWLLVVEEK